MPALVVLDAGTGGAKCAIFDLQGRRLAWQRQPWGYEVSRNPDFPFIKQFAFDPVGFWKILSGCIRDALTQSRVPPGDILGVATTSQREGCVFLDAEGDEIYAGPNLDSRGFNEGLEVLNTLGAQRLYEITGHSAPFIFPLVRYMWFRRHDPRAVARILMINDWMTYRLCDAATAEPSNATESMLFDLRRRTWSDEILQLFGIPVGVLPVIHESGDRAGSLNAAAAAATGLLAGTPVFMGGADTQCGLLGAGAIEPGDTAAILGTTTPVQSVVGEATFDSQGVLWSGCHVVPERWVIESNAGDTGDAYNWLVDLVVPGNDDRYARAEQLARAHTDGMTMMYAGPRIFDFSKMRHDRPGALFFPFPGMHMRPSAGELLRSFLESIAFAIRANMEQLEQLNAVRPDRLVAGGGMVRNRLLVELIADTTGLPVQQAEEPESAALGVAMLVATGAGAYPDVITACRAMGRQTIIEPNGDRLDRYASKYAKWRELNDSLDHVSL